MSRGVLALAVAFAAVAGGSAAAEENLLQKAALYAKPSVVRVVAGWDVTFGQVGREGFGGTGSGFFASSDGFIVTNAHVVEDIHEGEKAAIEKAAVMLLQRAEKQGERIDRAQVPTLIEQLKRIAKARAVAVAVLPDGTRLDYEIKAYGKPGESNDVAVIKVDVKDAPNLQLADAERVQVQDKILAIGYPGAADMQGTGLLDDKSQLEASINDGSVTAMKRSPTGETIIQINAAITHGNSGGPAINEKGEVIGLGTFGSKGEVQGFNFLVASSTVAKYITQAKVDTKPSKTIEVWKRALDEYYDEELDKAIASMEEALVLFPSHSEAPRLIKQARQLKKEGKGKSASSGGGGAAGAVIAIVLVLGILGAVIVVVVKSKKKGVQPGVPGIAGQPLAMAMAPQPGYPGPATGGVPVPAYAQHAAASHPMMAGAVGPQPITKTVAITPGSGHAPVAATAFGSLSMGSLTCTRGLLNGQRFALTPQGLLIGRQPGLAQIVVNDSRASGKHVWIGFENGTLVAIDQGTTNGTFVNDVRHGRISKAPLRDGDIVIVAEPDCLSLQLKLS